MKHILVLVWVFLGVSVTSSGRLSAHVEKTYYLKGKLGTRDLAVRMLCYDEHPTRHLTYFFGDDKRDRRLTGSLVDRFWTFLPETGKEKGGMHTGVSLKIAEDTQGAWNGTWTDSTGKSWNVVLTELKPEASAPFAESPFLKEPDPYDSYKLAHFHFVKTGTERSTKNLSCDWYMEKESRISFFRLRSPENKFQTGKVNESLRAIHLSLLLQYFGVHPDGEVPKVEAKLLYLSGELVSIQLLASGPVKEGKAAQARRLITLDRETGVQVDLEQLVWFDKSVPKPSPDDLYSTFKYRKAVFAPGLFRLLQELYPGKMNSDSCGRNKPESWALPVWALTQKGIAFSFTAVVPCDVLDWAVVPYEKLEPYLEKKYRLTPNTEAF